MPAAANSSPAAAPVNGVPKPAALFEAGFFDTMLSFTVEPFISSETISKKPVPGDAIEPVPSEPAIESFSNSGLSLAVHTVRIHMMIKHLKIKFS